MEMYQFFYIELLHNTSLFTDLAFINQQVLKNYTYQKDKKKSSHSQKRC